ncbi:class I SAM-dependent methyltransferase [Paraconexibacter algicola]|uniref:class I SAM-dependent methyltransferase n=1 Tax=Paraconexibacter algicola TaxID=2133960 RepID=UPI0018EE4ACE|nr:class I SAM-dependent methyltransferase [Paraconexibacter algicola]
MTLKSLAKRVTPAWAFRTRDRYRNARATRRFAGMPTDQVFETIYREGLWGGEAGGEPTSGRGSHDATIVEPYVAAVTAFLQELPVPPDAVDLGCGDFNVGSRIRPACGRYVACDVAASVIERNRGHYPAELDVDFRALDMLTEPLPEGDVAFVRQVLQHLSNAQIQQVLPKLRRYRWVLITEHVSDDPRFVPNLDIVAGPGIRTERRSGVVLADPPFSFVADEAREICRVDHEEGTIVTTAYRFDGTGA